MTKEREGVSTSPPKLPVAFVDETSTAKLELEKCYKRIADLETRIHDLTLQMSIVSQLQVLSNDCLLGNDRQSSGSLLIKFAGDP